MLQVVDTIIEGLEIEPENEALTMLFLEIKQEFEEDTSLPLEHPERQRFERLLKWLADGGSKFDKLKIRFYTEDYRGVHAARDIKKGETILYVPKKQIITLEMAFASPLGKKMCEKGLRQRLIGHQHSFLATFLMQEKRKTDS